jgi:protein SCO1/2
MLCTETLNGLTRAIRPLSWDAGKEFNVVTVSFDPRDTPNSAAAKKKLYVERYGRKGAAEGWAFLTGQAPAIKALADSVGFHYSYDQAMSQYAHATGIVILTPEGKVSRYFYGVEFSARDMRLALIEASNGSIGTPVERLLLYCYHYDPLTGRYALLIMRVLRLSALATVVLLAGAVLAMRRLEKERTA